MGSIFDRVSAMPADKRDALTQQFDEASRIAAAEPVATALMELIREAMAEEKMDSASDELPLVGLSAQ